MDADRTLGETREDDVPAPETAGARARVFDDSLELEPDVRSELEESVSEAEAPLVRPRTRPKPRAQRGASARLAWLEEQLEVREDAIRERVPH